MAQFILGVAVGIALHRFIMALILEYGPDDKCAYCEWMARKKTHRWM